MKNSPFHTFSARSISRSGYSPCSLPGRCRLVSLMVSFVRRNVWQGEGKRAKFLKPQFSPALYPTERAFPPLPYQYPISIRLRIDRPRQHLKSTLVFSPRRRKKSSSHMCKQLQTPRPISLCPTDQANPPRRPPSVQHQFLSPANRSSNRTFPISGKSKTDRPPCSSAIVVNTAVKSYYTLTGGQSSNPVAVRTLHIWPWPREKGRGP